MFVLSYHHVAATMAPAIHKLKYIQTKESCESLLQYQILLFNYLHPHRIRPFQWSCVVSLWILRFSIDLYMYINLVDGRGRWYGATHRYHTALHTLCLLLPVAVTATIAVFFAALLFFLLFSSIISVIYLLYISLVLITSLARNIFIVD